MSIQKKKMDIIAENVANNSTTRTEKGTEYKRKYLQVNSENKFQNQFNTEAASVKLNKTRDGHITSPGSISFSSGNDNSRGVEGQVMTDQSEGEQLYMPEHPDANDDGYVTMPNVNVVNEMVDMISATKNFEANLTAFNASKQIAKDSLEI